MNAMTGEPDIGSSGLNQGRRCARQRSDRPRTGDAKPDFRCHLFPPAGGPAGRIGKSSVTKYIGLLSDDAGEKFDEVGRFREAEAMADLRATRPAVDQQALRFQGNPPVDDRLRRSSLGNDTGAIQRARRVAKTACVEVDAVLLAKMRFEQLQEQPVRILAEACVAGLPVAADSP